MPEQEPIEQPTNPEEVRWPHLTFGSRGRQGVVGDRGLAGGTVPKAIDQALAGVGNVAAEAPVTPRTARMSLPADQLVVRAGRTPRTPIVVLTAEDDFYEVTFEGEWADLLALAYDIIDKIEVASPEHRRSPDADVVEARAILVEDVLRFLGVHPARTDLDVAELGHPDIRSARRLAQRAVDLLDRVVAR